MKQVILVRRDLKMEKGKLAAQVAHASVKAVLKADNKVLAEWLDEGMKKVVLKVDSKKDLIKYKGLAEDAGLKAALITDAAKTFFKQPTTTCLGIGPDDDDKIDSVTGSLQMY